MNLRLSGSRGAVAAARSKIAGDVVESGEQYWREVREQQYYFFENQLPLWRLSLAPATLHLPLQGQWFFDWGGALRWLASDMPAEKIRDAVAAEDGHATLFNNKALYGADVEVFHPLPQSLLQLHQRLKRVFDPNDILNRDRFYKYSL